MDSATLLTAPLSEDERNANEEYSRRVKCIYSLCQCYVDSLESNSYSYKNTVKALISIATTSIKNELVTQDTGERVLGHYILKCQQFIDNKGKGSKQVPSELVKLIKDGNWWLRTNHGCKTADASNVEHKTTYGYQYKTLNEYGVPISESQIKKWEYHKNT